MQKKNAGLRIKFAMIAKKIDIQRHIVGLKTIAEERVNTKGEVICFNCNKPRHLERAQNQLSKHKRNKKVNFKDKTI